MKSTGRSTGKNGEVDAHSKDQNQKCVSSRFSMNLLCHSIKLCSQLLFGGLSPKSYLSQTNSKDSTNLKEIYPVSVFDQPLIQRPWPPSLNIHSYLYLTIVRIVIPPRLFLLVPNDAFGLDTNCKIMSSTYNLIRV